MWKFYAYEEWRWVVRTTTSDLEDMRAQYKALIERALESDFIKEVYAKSDLNDIIDRAKEKKLSLDWIKQQIKTMLLSYL